jgi:hypothetical protein
LPISPYGYVADLGCVQIFRVWAETSPEELGVSETTLLLYRGTGVGKRGWPTDGHGHAFELLLLLLLLLLLFVSKSSDS